MSSDFLKELPIISKKMTYLQGAVYEQQEHGNWNDIAEIDNAILKYGLSLIDDYSMLTTNQQEIFKRALVFYKEFVAKKFPDGK